MQVDQLKRRDFITLLGGAAAAWPLLANAQQPAMPVVSFINGGAAEGMVRYAAAFRGALSEAGYVEGQNVTVEYHWLEGQYNRVSPLVADLVRRRVAVIAVPGAAQAAIAAKAATTTIPIVFGTGDDPVKLGLVTSLAQPGGNVTGTNFFFGEVVAKRLGLLHDFVPKAVRIAVLVNPTNAFTKAYCERCPKLRGSWGCKSKSLTPAADRESTRPLRPSNANGSMLCIAPDATFTSRRGQFATLAARDRIPASCANREMTEAGLLMSYGPNLAEMFRQVGVYTAKILKGAKPVDLPVLQSTKFEFIINLQTARALDLEVPNSIQLLADEVID
jgi:putative ABC transport system substrate-binding protein